MPSSSKPSTPSTRRAPRCAAAAAPRPARSRAARARARRAPALPDRPCPRRLSASARCAQERFAYRDNMTDVIVHNLESHEKARRRPFSSSLRLAPPRAPPPCCARPAALAGRAERCRPRALAPRRPSAQVRVKCREYIKRIALYRGGLAVQLPEKVLLYALAQPDDPDDMSYRCARARARARRAPRCRPRPLRVRCGCALALAASRAAAPTLPNLPLRVRLDARAARRSASARRSSARCSC